MTTLTDWYEAQDLGFASPQDHMTTLLTAAIAAFGEPRTVRAVPSGGRLTYTKQPRPNWRVRMPRLR